MENIGTAVWDCAILCGRGTKHLTRRLDTLITTAVLPVIILLLFTYLFGGAVSAALGKGANYLNYVVPGILLMSIGYCATTTATSINDDMTKGIVERFKTMPIVRPAFIIGHIVSALIRNVVATMLVIGVALLIGFRPTTGLSEWLATVGLLLLFAFALTALAVVLGLLASSPDAASAYGMPLMFLPYFTGAFVPISTMPKALQEFCTYQPVNFVWKAVSGLMLGGSGYNLVGAILWCAGIAIASLIFGGVLFARKTTR